MNPKDLDEKIERTRIALNRTHTAFMQDAVSDERFLSQQRELLKTLIHDAQVEAVDDILGDMILYENYYNIDKVNFQELKKQIKQKYGGVE